MFRYPEAQAISSPLDPIDDMLVLLEYLTSEDYLISILTSRQGILRKDAQNRAVQIIPHVRTATAFLQQSLQTQAELSFLPAYYGILNLMKVYILVGAYHMNLPAQRRHGATYPMEPRDSRNILTEHIVLKKKGAIPLFYRTIVGKALPASRVSMAQVYPYVTSISAEYGLATGKRHMVMRFKAEWKPHKHRPDKHIFTAKLMRPPGDTTLYTVRDFKALRQFKQDPTNKDIFIGRTFTGNPSPTDSTFRAQFLPFMLYGFHTDTFDVPYCSRRIYLPEELPIALLFFHVSNVVRYKPETLYKIRNSRFWPMLAAARQHSLLRMLVLAWSFLHNRNLVLSHKHE